MTYNQNQANWSNNSASLQFSKNPQTHSAQDKSYDNTHVEELRKQCNPSSINDVQIEGARYFVIISFTEDNVFKSVKHSCWCSTNYGNRAFDEAYKERRDKGPVYFLYSVAKTEHFCGVAMMTGRVDHNIVLPYWQTRPDRVFKGNIPVKWIYVKDVPNLALDHVRLPNNQNVQIGHARDAMEVPSVQGQQVMKIFHNYPATTCLFDDFQYYENKLEHSQAGR